MRLSVHMTNVLGIGAKQLCSSLIPALIECENLHIEKLFVPYSIKGDATMDYIKSADIVVFKRILPKSASRFLECTVLSTRYFGNGPLLVLGDIPLRVKNTQILFVQTPLLVESTSLFRLSNLPILISKLIFKMNAKRVSIFIVQTSVMKDALERTYPESVGKIRIVSQPVPRWLQLMSKKKTKSGVFKRSKADNLYLFYPAAEYEHKNHALLSKINDTKNMEQLVGRFVLTINNQSNPAPNVSWIECCGLLSNEQMYEMYLHVDALVFLSRKESYGFPLVEAMFMGLHVICPDLPYARVLCGSKAIYFDPENIASLDMAIKELSLRVKNGELPDWQDQLSKLTQDWEDVASRFRSAIQESCIQ